MKQCLLAHAPVGRYYGPQAATVEGVALFLRDGAACSPTRALVEGKVILVDSLAIVSFCGTDEYYRNLNAAGAAALVKMQNFGVPGAVTFSHQSWDTARYRDSAMTVVVIGSDGARLDTGALDGASIVISTPHNRDYYNMFVSPIRVVAMQIIVPLVGLYIFAIACEEARRIYHVLQNDSQVAGNPMRKETRQIGFLVCCTEGPAALLLAVVYALGHQGPTRTLPYTYHNFFFTRFLTTSFLSSIILSVLMREQLRASKPGYSPRLIFKTYGIPFKALLLVVFALDFVIGGFRAFFVNASAIFYIMFGLVWLFAGSMLGIFYLRVAFQLWVPIRKYRKIRVAVVGHENVPSDLRFRGLTRVMVTLAANGVILVIFFLIALWFVSWTLRESSPSGAMELVLLDFVSMFARLALSYWHIQVIRPSQGAPSYFAHLWPTYIFNCKKNQSEVTPGPPSSQSGTFASRREDGVPTTVVSLVKKTPIHHEDSEQQVGCLDELRSAPGVLENSNSELTSVKMSASPAVTL